MIFKHSKLLPFSLLCLILLSCNISKPHLDIPQIKLVKTYKFDSKTTQFPVEGLSGIDYDNSTQQYIAITDDKAEKAPARFYTFQLDKNFNINFIKETEFFDVNNQKFELGKVDGESIRYISQTKFIWSSEAGKIRPNVYIYDLNTKQNIELELPEDIYPSKDGITGARHNNFIEGIAVSPNKKYLLLSLEAPLIQDDELPTIVKGSKTRILVYNLKKLTLLKQFFYYLDPIPEESKASLPLQDNGISEIMFFNDQTLLVLERAGVHVGDFNFEFNNRLYVLNFAEVDLKKHGNNEFDKVIPYPKKLLLNFKSLIGTEQLNLEAMTLGPKINNKTSLLFMSDNNFNPLNTTTLMVFTVGQD